MGNLAESSTLKTRRFPLLTGRSTLARIQSDERLIALIRSGQDSAFEQLFERYRPRLLSFCRHMLGSKEDAEDVLQEVFASAYNAIRADNRDINVRPWLYRIARNRCLNHLRRPAPEGRDTMDDEVHAGGTTTADLVHKRADLRHLLQDIQKLPESQRTALLLREIDAMSYEQIADAMETTVPSVKSLLVRARMSLAEAAEARRLTCSDVRLELAAVAEGLKKPNGPIRRHLRQCDPCSLYRTQLRKTSTAMAFALPVGSMLALKKLLLAKLGLAAAGGGGAATGGATASGLGAAGAGTAAGTAAGAAGAAVPFGLSAVATKAITVTAATALLAGGAVEVKRVARPDRPITQAAAPAATVPDQPAQAVERVVTPPAGDAKGVAETEKKDKPADAKDEGAQGSTAPTEGEVAEDGEEIVIDPTTTTPNDPTATVPPVVEPTTPPVPTDPQTAPAPQPQTGGATLPSSGQQSPPPGAGEVEAEQHVEP